MSFIPDKLDEFESLFQRNKEKIRNFPGVNKLELYKDKSKPNIYFTYSYWDGLDDLEVYRNSDLFKGIWSETKELFNGKPEAWSVEQLISI